MKLRIGFSFAIGILALVILVRAQDFPDLAPLGIDGNASMYISAGKGRLDDWSLYPIQITLSTNSNPTTTTDSWTNFNTYGISITLSIVYTNVLTYGVTNVTVNGSLFSTDGYTNNVTQGSTNSVYVYVYTTNSGSSSVTVNDPGARLDPVAGPYTHGGDQTNDNVRYKGGSLAMRIENSYTVSFWMRITAALPATDSGYYWTALRSAQGSQLTLGFLYDARASSTGWTAVVSNPFSRSGYSNEVVRNVGQLDSNRWYRVSLIWNATTTNATVLLNGKEPPYYTAGTNYASLFDPNEPATNAIAFRGDLGTIGVWPRAFATNEYGRLSR